MNLHGLQIVPNSYARDVRTEYHVERNPIRKRRRNWRVVVHHINRPGCWQMGNTLYMHPELIEKLKLATSKGGAA